MIIVDAHAHFGVGSGVPQFAESLEAFLEHSDKVKCTYLIQAACVALAERPSFENLNELCEGYYEKSDGRVLSFLIYNPHYQKECVELIEKYHDKPYFVGIKIHPSGHYMWADDESYRPVWELADKYNLPIMSHTWALTSNPVQKYSTPERFEKYLNEYPNVKFVFGHSGGRAAGIKVAAAMGEKYKNTYFDLAGDVYDRKLVEYLVSHVGADRVLIGSDIGWFDLTMPIGMVLGADLTLEEKEYILGKTAMQLYRIEEKTGRRKA